MIAAESILRSFDDNYFSSERYHVLTFSIIARLVDKVIMGTHTVDKTSQFEKRCCLSRLLT